MSNLIKWTEDIVKAISWVASIGSKGRERRYKRRLKKELKKQDHVHDSNN